MVHTSSILGKKIFLSTKLGSFKKFDSKADNMCEHPYITLGVRVRCSEAHYSAVYE